MMELILCTSEDGKSQIELRAEGGDGMALPIGDGGTLRCHEAEHRAAPEKYLFRTGA